MFIQPPEKQPWGGTLALFADPDGNVAIIDAGNPGMASGGTGDVLAGIIGGLLAQRIDISSAARLGALLHGAAGDAAARSRGQVTRDSRRTH